MAAVAAASAAAPNTGAEDELVLSSSTVFDIAGAMGRRTGSPRTPDTTAAAASQAQRDVGASASGDTALESAGDPREVRRRKGQVGWKPEQGVPDVGGLGWRTRQGHLLKNQTYYGGMPKQNIWDNPTHAGPKTWRAYHGPKLRAGADLMEYMDRRDVEAEEAEAKKTYVNTTRVRTLDRFYQKRIENEQKERAGSWAPHRRARREVHKQFEGFEAELDSMPAKELKKVLTEKVLQKDEDAIRRIFKRIQQEEDWKRAWRQMERERHDDIRSDLELRTQYNDMLMQMSGQQPSRDSRRGAAQATRHTEDLSQPRHQRPLDNVAALSDLRGLVHVDNQHALEALFPGQGHEMAVEVVQKAQRRERVGDEPRPQSRSAQQKTVTCGKRRSTVLEEADMVRRGSLPVSHDKLSKVALRHDSRELGRRSTMQFQSTAAPPAPEQNDSLLQEALISSARGMGKDFSPRSQHTLNSMQSHVRHSLIDTAPPTRPLVYPVAVEATQAPRPKRVSVASAPTSPFGAHGASSSLQAAGAQQLTPRGSHGDPWPPVGSQAVDIEVGSASGLPKADPAAHGGAYVVCRIIGKQRARVLTGSTASPAEQPQWDEALTLQGWKLGDDLEIAVFAQGSEQRLAAARLPSASFFPGGFDGRLRLESCLRTSGAQPTDGGEEPPAVDLRVVVQESIEMGPEATAPLLLRREALSMSHATPTTSAVVHDLDDFEANMKTEPVIGNFWMTPRGDPRSARAGARQCQRPTASAQPAQAQAQAQAQAVDPAAARAADERGGAAADA